MWSYTTTRGIQPSRTALYTRVHRCIHIYTKRTQKAITTRSSPCSKTTSACSHICRERTMRRSRHMVATSAQLEVLGLWVGGWYGWVWFGVG